ncbi:MAG: hypothetical protein HGA67_00290 [Candidatus Yonathbacteria bacterium]|nr:hypothetical protein [Candidatus Yonathbacteria bacterium]
MKTDEQLREGFKVYRSEDESIIYVSFFHNETETDDNVRATELVIGDIQIIMSTAPGTVFAALVDTVPIGGGLRVVLPESRKKYAELISNDHVQKVAFLGTNDLVASLIGTIADLTGHPGKVKWFSDAEEAKDWLKE